MESRMLLVQHDNLESIIAKNYCNRSRIAALFILLVLTVRTYDCYHATTDNVRYGPSCDSYIYCHGPLLHTIQMASLYTDSKTFVDMKLKEPPNVTMTKFQTFMNQTSNRPTKHQLEFWVTEHFDPEGSEFVPWEPDDWVNKPKFLEGIKDEKLRNWASALNLLWKFLGRKMTEDVFYNPSLYSIMYVPHPVIVPGGRFREFYYWDSYWIMRGLLLSEMNHTVRGMLENYLYIVKNHGLIPNGGRVYYKMRSHPPLLIPMVQLYIEATDDTQFITEHVYTMEKEFQFWMRNRTVKVEKDGKYYTLARYRDQSSGPRPESYREDYEAASFFREEDEKLDFYNELKSAAESGWDFSTRWFILNGTNKGNLTNLKTRSIIPVELNSILCWNARLLNKYFEMVHDDEMAAKYDKMADEWMEAVKQVLWHEEVGVWLDYDILNENKRDYFYPTNIAPFWTGCYRKNETKYYVTKVLKYLEKTQVMNNNQGGIPSSLEHSGEQWDYPNAWAPLQYIMIMALDNTGYSWAQDLAFDIAERWTRSNYAAYNAAHIMYEKYDASVPGGRGGGGEYEVQIGFGWSNGLILHLLHKYGDRITHDDNSNQAKVIVASAANPPIRTAASNCPLIILLLLSLSFYASSLLSSFSTPVRYPIRRIR